MGFDSNKPRHTVLSPECVSKFAEYAFTISPGDSLQFTSSGNYKSRFTTFYDCMLSFLSKYLEHYARYRFRVEISSLGRLHLHGTVIISDIFGFYSTFIPKIIKVATIEMDTISDRNKWIDYMYKQQSCMPFHTEITEKSMSNRKQSDTTKPPIKTWETYYDFTDKEYEEYHKQQKDEAQRMADIYLAADNRLSNDDIF